MGYDERFNSKLVRLKGQPRRLGKTMSVRFQFQTGAIKRWLLDKAIASEMKRFNSKLVRLKGNHLIEEKLRKHGFNSKLVRLKGYASSA